MALARITDYLIILACSRRRSTIILVFVLHYVEDSTRSLGYEVKGTVGTENRIYLARTCDETSIS